MSNPFWDYSLAAYALDGVATSCLTLQDSYGLDVNLLLYAAWLAGMDQRLIDQHLAGVEAAIVVWRDTVIKPMRTLHRQLQDYPPASGVLDEIKVLELRAEQLQQDMMYAYFQQADDLPRTPRPLQDNLWRVAHFVCPGDPAWEPFIDRLVTLFPL